MGQRSHAVNLDMKGMALLDFWQGAAESAKAVFEIRR